MRPACSCCVRSRGPIAGLLAVSLHLGSLGWGGNAHAAAVEAPPQPETQPETKTQPESETQTQTQKSATTAAPEPASQDGEAEDAFAPQPEETEAEAEGKRKGKRKRKWLQPGGPNDDRKWMVGVDGVVTQVPPLRTRVVFIDPRFVGRSVAMGGVGIFGRYRPSPWIGFDLSVRSGSVRYDDEERENTIAQDQVLAEVGTLVYLGRGDVAQFALSGGLGGMYNRVGYDLQSGRDGVHMWGSGLVRVGAEAEFLVKRVAFVLSFRTYGVFTVKDAVTKKGELLEADRPEHDRVPVAPLQTQLSVSAGIAYRF